MKTIKINHFRTGQTLYEGRFAHRRDAVEAAIQERVSLAFADLRHANLANAEMDGAILDGAQLCHANLLGANLSEASLNRTSFENALLHSTTLCESVIEAANFDGALCGATDIAGASIRNCLFSTLSALQMNFSDAHTLSMNGFMAVDEYLCAFSRPPLVVHGLSETITCLDHKMLIGHYALMPHNPADYLKAPFHGFLQTHQRLLQDIWLAHYGTPWALRVA